MKPRIYELIDGLPEASKANPFMQLQLASFTILNDMASSLERLTIKVSVQYVKWMKYLKNCLNLKLLNIIIHDQEINDIDMDIQLHVKSFEWLKSCRRLRSLSLGLHIAAPHIAYEILRQPDIALRRLTIPSTFVDISSDFYSLLGSKTSLEHLEILEIPYRIDETDLEDYIQAIPESASIRVLKVRDQRTMSFHIWKIIERLKNLRELDLMASGMSLAHWTELHNLRCLTLLKLHVFCKSPVSDILKFVRNLGPGNAGLVIDMRESDFTYTNKEINCLQQALQEAVGGSFLCRRC